MKTGLKSPFKQRSLSFGQTLLQGTIRSPWLPTSFSLIQSTLITGGAGVLYVKIDGLQLAAFELGAKREATKLTWSNGEDSREGLAQDVSQSRINGVIYVDTGTSLIPKPRKCSSVLFLHSEEGLLTMKPATATRSPPISHWHSCCRLLKSRLEAEHSGSAVNSCRLTLRTPRL